MERPFILGISATGPAVTDCPCCVEEPDHIVRVTTSHDATPLQIEAEAVIRPAPAAQPRTAERVHFAQPGKFQLQK
jgi:hypothetical protein